MFLVAGETRAELHVDQDSVSGATIFHVISTLLMLNVIAAII